MWLGAFPVNGGLTTSAVLSAALAVGAIVLSIAAFAKGAGAQYAVKGSRRGLVVAVLGFVLYLAGTSMGSAPVHAFSIALFFCGCAFFLAGWRALVSALPSGLIVTSSFAPFVRGQWGLIYLDSLAWAILVTSMGLLWDLRSAPRTAPCGLCLPFEIKGWGFCGACGRQISEVSGPSPRALVGFVIFALAMAAAFEVGVPLAVAANPPSLAVFTLGGPQGGGHFAPLPSWGSLSSSFSQGGIQFKEYALTNKGAFVDAFVASSPDANVFNKTRTGTVTAVALPPAIAQYMSAYTFVQKGTGYVDIQGAFQVTTMNESVVQGALVSIDLRQTASAFAADHGSSLYGAAYSVISWAAASSQWSPWAGDLSSAYRLFSQAAVASSFACVGVVLFTVARDDEQARSKRSEAARALDEPESLVLGAFGSRSRSLTGAQIAGMVARADPRLDEGRTYSALDELERRGLVSKSVTLVDSEPVLKWRRLT